MIKNVLVYFPFRFKYYLMHPIEFFRQCINNCVSAWQRIKYGYCGLDVWNFDDWLLNIIPSILTKLKKEGHSYPANMANRDEWCAYLTEISECFYQAQEDVIKNEYEEEWHNYLAQRRKAINNSFIIYTWPTDSNLNQLYFTREKEIFLQRQQLVKKAFEMLSNENIFFNLWD